MKYVKTVTALFLSAVISSATLAEKPADVGNPKLPEQAQLRGAASGGSLQSMGTASDGVLPVEMSQKEFAALNTAAGSCYDSWWLSGEHEWEWRSYWAYWKAKLVTSTWTRYGTTSAPCDIPLTVDQLKVYAFTVATDSYYNTYPKLVINKTVSNVSRVGGKDDENVYGDNLPSKGPCGAWAEHTSTKNGVTWKSVGRDGCEGNPGTW